MRPRLLTVYCLLVTVLFSCTPQPPQLPLQNKFYVYRFNPPSLIEFSKDFQNIREIPLSVPPNCELFNLFPSPVGKYIAMELSCPNGQTVLFLDTDTARLTQPISDSDSHFLAWDRDGSAAFLKVDSLGNAHVARVDPDGKNEFVPVTEFTYDLAVNSRDDDFVFTFSRGLGQGSELWHAQWDGKIVKQMYSDSLNYISFAHYSPGGQQIAFIKIPDTQTAFTVGELWVMDAGGTNAHKLADADAGHGYAANWSPDGKRIAFVVRENPNDARADQSSDALISNIYIVDVKTGALTQVTHIDNGRTETPAWSPEGNTLAFNVVINDRMTVQIADIRTGESRALLVESSCCPAWLGK
jgi:Tol biopolymer transport system component